MLTAFRDSTERSNLVSALSATNDMTSLRHHPPRLRLNPPPPPPWLGKNGFKRPAKAARFRVCINNSPGPINSATIPSPLIILRKKPEAALRRVYWVEPSHATRGPVSNTYLS